MEQNFSTNKWYDSKALIIILFFIMPPLGVYGMIKRNTVVWKKVLYILPASFFIFTIFIGIVGAFLIDTDKNKLEKTNDSTKIVIDEVKIKTPPVDIDKLIEFQKTWSDSVVKVENTPMNGKHLVGSKLVLPDSIFLEYSEGVTKNNFAGNMQIDSMLYRKWYRESIVKKLGVEFANYPVYIIPIANRKIVSKIDKSINYVRPALAFEGIKIYKGNEYYKEYIGKVKCLYKDENKSFDDINQKIVIVVKGNNEINIPYYYFQENYWTTDKENDATKYVNKCY